MFLLSYQPVVKVRFQKVILFSMAVGAFQPLTAVYSVLYLLFTVFSFPMRHIVFAGTSSDKFSQAGMMSSVRY